MCGDVSSMEPSTEKRVIDKTLALNATTWTIFPCRNILENMQHTLCSLVLSWKVYGFQSKSALCDQDVWSLIHLSPQNKEASLLNSEFTDQDQRSKQPIFNHWPLTHPGVVFPHVVHERSGACAKTLTAIISAIWTNDQIVHKRQMREPKAIAKSVTRSPGSHQGSSQEWKDALIMWNLLSSQLQSSVPSIKEALLAPGNRHWSFCVWSFITQGHISKIAASSRCTTCVRPRIVKARFTAWLHGVFIPEVPLQLLSADADTNMTPSLTCDPLLSTQSDSFTHF